MQKYLYILVLLILNGKLIKCDIFEECDGIADESFVASRTNCSTYIYCLGDESQTGECEEGQYFDPEGLACDDKANVFCALDEVEEVAGNEEVIETELTTIQSIASTTTTTTTTAIIVANTESAITTTTLSYTQTNTAMNIITSAPLVQQSCPAQDDPNQIVLIGNNMSCADYYVCYHGHAIQMHCSSTLHFNMATGQCDYPENVKCFETADAAVKCLPHVTDFFPHPENCNYFYYCIRGFLTVQQCPFFYGWDYERRACVQISQAKCYNKKTAITVKKILDKLKYKNKKNNYLTI